MMMPEDLTIQAALQHADRLKAISETPELDAQLILCHAIGAELSYLRTWPEKKLDSDQLAVFSTCMQRREQGEPVAYILGSCGFWSLDLEVSTATLIPRPDTECLVEFVIERFSQHALRVLDLGTGTGAIALALVKQNPDWRVVGTDYNADVVRLAQRNAQRNGITNAVFRCGSWFEALEASERFDLIVSNPPYIDPTDPHLQHGDVQFEPRSALVAKENGLADLEHIVRYAPSYLRPAGAVLLEHGFEQGELVRAMMRESGYVNIETGKDYGANERFTVGYLARSN